MDFDHVLIFELFPGTDDAFVGGGIERDEEDWICESFSDSYECAFFRLLVDLIIRLFFFFPVKIPLYFVVVRSCARDVAVAVRVRVRVRVRIRLVRVGVVETEDLPGVVVEAELVLALLSFEALFDSFEHAWGRRALLYIAGRNFCEISFLRQLFLVFSMHRATVRVSARYASTAATPKTIPAVNRKSTPFVYHPNQPADKVPQTFSKLFDKFTKKASEGQNGISRNWKHTETRRGEEQRLRKTIKEAGEKSADTFFKGHPASIQSLEQQTFSAPSTDSLDDDDLKFSLETPFGSFVEMRR